MIDCEAVVSEVWINSRNGWSFEISCGHMALNGRRVSERPDWADGAPQFRFGPVIPWRGGECPVPADTIIRAHFRGRLPYIGMALWPSHSPEAQAVMWHHAPSGRRSDPAFDIVAYQVAHG